MHQGKLLNRPSHVWHSSSWPAEMAYRACASSPPPSMLEAAFAVAEGETFGSSTTAGTRPRYCRCSAYRPAMTTSRPRHVGQQCNHRRRRHAMCALCCTSGYGTKTRKLKLCLLCHAARAGIRCSPTTAICLALVACASFTLLRHAWLITGAHH